MKKKSLSVLSSTAYRAVYRMSVGNDKAFERLAVNAVKLDARHYSAVFYVGENVARSDAGQLILVAHKHEPGAGIYMVEQRFHEEYIHHGKLVHYHDVA